VQIVLLTRCELAAFTSAAKMALLPLPLTRMRAGPSAGPIFVA